MIQMFKWLVVVLSWRCPPPPSPFCTFVAWLYQIKIESSCSTTASINVLMQCLQCCQLEQHQLEQCCQPSHCRTFPWSTRLESMHGFGPGQELGKSACGGMSIHGTRGFGFPRSHHTQGPMPPMPSTVGHGPQAGCLAGGSGALASVLGPGCLEVQHELLSCWVAELLSWRSIRNTLPALQDEKTHDYVCFYSFSSSSIRLLVYSSSYVFFMFVY